MQHISRLGEILQGPAHKASTYVFVYGTLRKGQCRQHVMSKCEPISCMPGCTQGKLLDLGSYPGLVVGQGNVVGELHKYADEDIAPMLEVLDQIEGYVGHDNPDNLYDRVLVQVFGRPNIQKNKEASSFDPGGDGGAIEFGPKIAWGYRYRSNPETVSRYEVIGSGDWVEHFNARRDEGCDGNMEERSVKVC